MKQLQDAGLARLRETAVGGEEGDEVEDAGELDPAVSRDCGQLPRAERMETRWTTPESSIPAASRSFGRRPHAERMRRETMCAAECVPRA